MTLAERTTLLRVLTVAAVAVLTGAAVAKGMSAEAPRGRRRKARMSRNGSKRYQFTHDPDGANPEDAPERGSIEDAIDWAIESGGWVYLWGYNNEDCGAVSPEGKYIGGEEYDGGGGGEEEDGDW